MLNSFGHFAWLVKLLQFIWLKLNSILIENTRFYKKCKIVQRHAAEPEPAYRPIPIVKGAPVVGTLFELIAAGGASRLHEYVDKRHQQHGVIFRERLGGTQDAVFVASAKLMRSVFLFEGQCPRHPLPDAWQLYNKAHKQKRGLFFMDGAEWLQTRRILNRLLLTGNMEWMKPAVAASTTALINKWRQPLSSEQSEHTELPINNLESELYRWSIDVICAIMFGTRYTNEPLVQQTLDEFAQIVYKIFASSAALMNFPAKIAKACNLRVWQEFEANVGTVLCKAAHIIEKFLALLGEQAEVAQQTTLYGRLKQTGMSLELLKRIFVDLVIAAADTTAYSTQWALYLLARDGSMQRRVLAETQRDAGDCAYLRGLIKETLRLYPVAPFVGRYLASDALIGDYCVRKDTLVLLSLYTAGRDAAHFPEPLLVQPERWQRNEQTDQLAGVLQAHGSLPFAIGQRSCIGKRIALMQMEQLLSALVTNFELQCRNSTPIEPILRMITVPNQPLQLVLKRRACT